MKTIFLFLVSVTLLLTVKFSYSQLSIDAKAYTNGNLPSDTVEVCLGDSVFFISNFINQNQIITNFNNSSLDPGWYSNEIICWTNPCPPDSLPASGKVCWMGDSIFYNRKLATKFYAIDSLNCWIEWDMKYGANQNLAHCNPPDLPNEGIYFQYSIDSGFTWTQFAGVDLAPSGNYGDTNYINGSGGYWTPVEMNAATGPYYTWNHYKNIIPIQAVSPNTRFRWYQDMASGYSFDQWGIDNVKLTFPIQPYVEWSCAELPLWHYYDFYPPSFIANLPGTYHFTISVIDLLSSNSATDIVSVNVHSIPPTPIIYNYGDSLVSSSNVGNQWYLDGNLIVGATDNYHIATVNGNYQVLVSLFSCVSDTSNTITINSVDINKIVSNKEFLLQPNPANEYFSIQTIEKITQLQIFDMSGKLIKSFIKSNKENNYYIKDLTKGLFFVKIYTEKSVSVQKLIKL